MKATELRIGNWVLEPMKSKGIVSWGQCQIFHGDFKLCESNPELYKPIPLTEEWLKKFGLEQQGSHEQDGENFIEFGIDDRFSITCLRRSGVFEMDYDVGYSQQTRTLKYVHQLQNLYFALTETELELI